METPQDIEITEGLTLKRDENAPIAKETEIPQGRATESTIDNLLVDRFVDFMSSHTLQFKIPKSTSDDMKRSLEEGKLFNFKNSTIGF